MVQALDWGAFIAAVGTIPWDNKHPWRMGFYALLVMFFTHMNQTSELPEGWMGLGPEQRKWVLKDKQDSSKLTSTAAAIAGIHLSRGTTLGYWAGGIPVANIGINTVTGEYEKGIWTLPTLGFGFLFGKLGWL